MHNQGPTTQGKQASTRNAPLEEHQVSSYSANTAKVIREMDQSVIDYDLLEDTITYLSSHSRVGDTEQGIDSPDVPEDGAILVRRL